MKGAERSLAFLTATRPRYLSNHCSLKEPPKGWEETGSFEAVLCEVALEGVLACTRARRAPVA
jgi:hypothetical protein